MMASEAAYHQEAIEFYQSSLDRKFALYEELRAAAERDEATASDILKMAELQHDIIATSIRLRDIKALANR